MPDMRRRRRRRWRARRPADAAMMSRSRSSTARAHHRGRGAGDARPDARADPGTVPAADCRRARRRGTERAPPAPLSGPSQEREDRRGPRGPASGAAAPAAGIASAPAGRGRPDHGPPRARRRRRCTRARRTGGCRRRAVARAVGHGEPRRRRPARAGGLARGPGPVGRAVGGPGPGPSRARDVEDCYDSIRPEVVAASLRAAGADPRALLRLLHESPIRGAGAARRARAERRAGERRPRAGGPCLRQRTGVPALRWVDDVVAFRAGAHVARCV